MGRTITLQKRFDRGMIRDLPIDQLPEGALHDIIDMIPSLKGGLSKRSAWTRHSATLGNTYCAALCYAPFAAVSQVVAITNTGAVKQVSVTASTVTARGTAQVPFQPPVFYRELVYIPSDNGTTTVKSYSGSADAIAATGSPPTGMFATTYKDHLVLARDATNPTRVWFSNGGDAGVWDTAADGQWLNTTRVITGLATLNNMILVFSEHGVERIRGDIIPGVAGSDMVVEPAYNIGTADASSIAVDGDYVVYANANGIWLTDGIARPVDLTAECGIKSYYRDLLTVYTTTYTLAAGIYQGHYIISIMDGTTLVAVLCLDIFKRRAWRLTNIKAAMMTTAPSTSDARSGDLFFGERDNPFVSRLGSMFFIEGFEHNLSGSADGNGTDPAPSFTTGYLRGVPGTKRWKRLYVHNTLHDGDAATNPTGTVGVYTSPRLAAVGGGQEGLSETDAEANSFLRKPIRLSIPASDGIGVVVALDLGSGNTDAFSVYMIEAEVQQREQSH